MKRPVSRSQRITALTVSGLSSSLAIKADNCAMKFCGILLLSTFVLSTNDGILETTIISTSSSNRNEWSLPTMADFTFHCPPGGDTVF